jgi:hypothetical protein
VAQYKTAIQEKDRLQHQLLDEIAIELDRFKEQPVNTASSSCSDEQRYNRILEESSLIPFIELLLMSHTMLEMENQYKTYEKVFMVSPISYVFL